MSASKVSQIAEQIVGQLFHKPPIRVIDRASDVLPASAGANDNTSGFVFDGTIHLVRSGLGSRADTVKTFWHELLHYGLRRFITKGYYINAMRDSWIINTQFSHDASPIVHATLVGHGIDENIKSKADALEAAGQADGTFKITSGKLLDAVLGGTPAAQAHEDHQAIKVLQDLGMSASTGT